MTGRHNLSSCGSHKGTVTNGPGEEGKLMVKKYVSSKSTKFYPDDPNGEALTLIFGDEVDSTEQLVGDKERVVYRRRVGLVKKNQLMLEHPLEMYFVDVGQGDSTFIVTPAGKNILIDGGSGNEAFQFLVWKYRLDEEGSTGVDIDLLVLTHADGDHIKGLAAIIEHDLIRVHEIVHSGIAKFSSGFNTELGDMQGPDDDEVLVTRHDGIQDLQGADLNTNVENWFDAVKREVEQEGMVYRSVCVDTGIIDVGDPSIALRVLGPKLLTRPGQAHPVYPWFSNPSHTVNGHSVVLRLDYKAFRVLLPGDLNEDGVEHLNTNADFAAQCDAHLLKAPHHGSHEYCDEFLKAVNAQITVVSSGETPDHGHPRANFMAAAGRWSRSNEPLLFSTELVAQFSVDENSEGAADDLVIDPTDAAKLVATRQSFKKNLNGIINVRTDGTYIYCARRVAAGYHFVTYKQKAAARSQP